MADSMIQNTWYVVFELLLRAPFVTYVADEIWRIVLEPARTRFLLRVAYVIGN